MNVGLFADCYAPTVSGVVTSLLQLKQGLEQRGHKVVVFTAATPGYAERDGSLRPFPSLPFNRASGFRLALVNPQAVLRMVREGKTLREIPGAVGGNEGVVLRGCYALYAAGVVEAVTPDAQRAVSASYDRTLRVWDLDSGDLRQRGATAPQQLPSRPPEPRPIALSHRSGSPGCPWSAGPSTPPCPGRRRCAAPPP